MSDRQAIASPTSRAAYKTATADSTRPSDNMTPRKSHEIVHNTVELHHQREGNAWRPVSARNVLGDPLVGVATSPEISQAGIGAIGQVELRGRLG